MLYETWGLMRMGTALQFSVKLEVALRWWFCT